MAVFLSKVPSLWFKRNQRTDQCFLFLAWFHVGFYAGPWAERVWEKLNCLFGKHDVVRWGREHCRRCGKILDLSSHSLTHKFNRNLTAAVDAVMDASVRNPWSNL